MIKLSDYLTETAFPPEMRSPERIALAYAFDMQKKKFLEHIKKVYLWADINNVDENKLDFLAVENRVLFYDSSFPADTKRKLIENSVYWHMILGTRQSMEEIINIIFGNENTAIEEWYMYGGDPYHFRILIDSSNKNTMIDMNYIEHKIKLYKRLSAHLDSINIRKVRKGILYIANNTEIFVKSNIKVYPRKREIKRTTGVKIISRSMRYIEIIYRKQV